ncbi:MAG: PAS domain S-box protein [Bacteroidota bacterium]
MDDYGNNREELAFALSKLKEENQALRASLREALGEGAQTTKPLGLETPERYRLAAEIGLEGLWDWNIAENSIYYSAQWKAMLGFSETEMQDTVEEWSRRIHPDDLALTKSQVEKHMKGGSAKYSCEHRVMCKNGNFIWLLDEGRIISRDEQGNPLRFFGTSKTISERKKTEYDLNERVKELNCHNRISQFMADPGLSMDEVIRNIVEIMPESWQFPQFAEAAIVIRGKEFKTAGFYHTTDSQIQEVTLDGEKIGRIEVMYRGGLVGTGPHFLPEEGQLLFTIANRLANFVDKHEKNTALTRSEGLYKSLIENISDVIYEIDPRGDITYISPSIRNMLGFTTGEIIGKNFTCFVGYNSEFLLQRLALLSEINEISGEYKIASKSGEEHWIRLSTKAVTEGGTFRGGMGTLIDITEKKQMEIELRRSELLYSSILAASPDTISITDLEGRIIFASPRSYDMFGYDRSFDFKGHPLLDFIDEKDHPKAITAITEMARGNLLGADEYKGIRADGATFDVEVKGEFIRDAEGNRVNMIFVTRDISQRKSAEERLRQSEECYKQMVETINDVIYEVSTDGTIRYVSPAIGKMMGYSPEELTGKNFFSFLHADDRPAIVHAFANLDQKESSYLEYRYMTKDGQARWVRSSTTPIFENGILTGGNGTLTDIHNRKLAEENISRVSRLKSVISNINQALIHEKNRDRLFEKVCNIAIVSGKFQMAWIGLIDEETKIVKPFVHDGIEDGYLSSIRQISVSDIPEGRGPTGTALRNGVPSICNDIENDPHNVIWRSEALARNYRSSIALPITLSGKIIGAFTLYSSHPGFFNAEEVGLLTEVVENLDFALESIETEKERRRVENELRKLSRAIEYSPLSIVMTNVDGDIEYANPKACETTGFTLAELVGRNPRVLQSGDTPKEEYTFLWNTIGSGKEWHGIFHNRKKNGELYWESSTIAPVLDENGTITNYVAIKEDITLRKKAEEEIIKFRTIADNANFGSAITNMEGNFLYVNDAFADMHQLKANELIGQNIRIFHNDEQLPYVEKLIGELVTTGEFKSKEVWHVRTDGTVFPTLMEASLICNEKNEPMFLSATAVEISAQKEWEESLVRSKADLNYAQEIAGMGSWEIDYNTGKTKWSENYYRILGLEPFMEEIPNDYFYSLVHPGDRHLLDRKLEEIKESGKATSVDLRLVMPDGRTKWVQNNIVPVFENDRLAKLKGVNVDITVNKSNEEKLKEQNERLNAMMQAMPDMIFLIDKEGTYLEYYIPDALKKNLVNEQTIIGSTLTEMFEKSTAEQHLQMLRECLSSQKLATYDYMMQEAGEVTYYEARMAPMGTDKVLTFVRDITARKEAEKQIQKLSLAVTQSPVSVVITNLEGIIEFTNPAFTETTGYLSEEVKGKSTRILKSGRNDPATYAELWNTIVNGSVWEKEWINKRKDGEFYWEHISITPIHDETGRIINFLAVKQDISQRKLDEQEIRNLNLNLEKKIQERTSELATTNATLLKEIDERKKTEEKFATAFRSGSALMAISDFESGQYVDVNNTFTETIGYSREEIIGRTNSELCLFVDPELRGRLLKSLVSQIPVRKIEVLIRAKDGACRTILLSADTIFLGDQRCLLTVSVDITDRKNAEEEIKKARQEAEHANRAKSEFLANMSHEIRTPMNAILGYSELLGSMVSEQMQKEFLNSIKTSGNSLLTLINDILDLSKIEAGKLELEFDYIDTVKFFSEFEKIFSFKISEKGLQFHTEISSGSPAFLYVDGSRLRQILLNLVGNAVKFTNHGEITIRVLPMNPRVTTYQNVKNEELIDLVIEISDTGIGIPEEFFNHIFDSFIQVKSKTNKGGTGLGLPITQRLVELMKGTITLKSQVGRGSTFTVTIPEVPFLRSYETLPGSSSIDPANIIFERSTILIVDDIEENRRFIRDALRETALTFREAENGFSAIDLLNEEVPDMVITDIRMPGMDGFELLGRIKEDPRLRDIPVIAYSASVMKEQKERINNSAFAALLIKPVQISELYEALMNKLPFRYKDQQGATLQPAAPAGEPLIDAEGMIAALSAGLAKTRESFNTRQPIGGIRKFGNELVSLGKQHHCQRVTEYGESLVHAADSFNIENILKLLKQYYDIIDSIKE